MGCGVLNVRLETAVKKIKIFKIVIFYYYMCPHAFIFRTTMCTCMVYVCMDAESEFFRFGEFLDFLFLKRKEKKQHVQRHNSLSKDNIRVLLLYYTFFILFSSFSGHGLGYS